MTNIYLVKIGFHRFSFEFIGLYSDFKISLIIDKKRSIGPTGPIPLTLQHNLTTILLQI